MSTTDMEGVKSKEKGLFLKPRHLKILELGDKLLLSVELFGYRTEERIEGGNATYTYKLLVGESMFFQMEPSGAFTGLFETIEKDQYENGTSQNYTGSVIFVKDDVLRVYFNEHPENFIKEKKLHWDPSDSKRGNSVVREIKMDGNFKRLSDGVVSSGQKPVVILARSAFSANGNLVLFGTDFDNYFGAVVK